jgi:hypothetical protein
MIFVTGDKTGIVVRGVLGLASPSPSDSPAARLVVIVLIFFRATISCSDLDFG